MKSGHNRKCRTGKARFRSELGARMALVRLRENGSDVKRYYKCTLCQGWHLTSKLR